MPNYLLALLPLKSSWARDILAGIEARCAERQLYVQVDIGPIECAPLEVLDASCRGIIMVPQALAELGATWQVAQLLDLGVRVLNCSSEPLTQQLVHSVCSDAAAVGALSGRYLHRCGIEHVAAFGLWSMVYNEARRDALQRYFPELFFERAAYEDQCAVIAS
jgi:DNA-binding LacI/PurR family transcriptional regulator